MKSKTVEQQYTHIQECGSLSLSALESVKRRWWCSYFAAAQHYFPHTRKNEVRALAVGGGKKMGSLCAPCVRTPPCVYIYLHSSACTQKPTSDGNINFSKSVTKEIFIHMHTPGKPHAVGMKLSSSFLFLC